MMARLIDTFMEWMDSKTEARSRRIASMSGRRSFLHKAAAALVGGAVLPMLPYDNSNGVAYARAYGEPDDIPLDCDYWRYCSLHGGLCAECGGSISQCPPGSIPSKVAWVGTCRNPNDGKDYLVSYNDCCGKGGNCGSGCSRQEGDRPGYRYGLASESSWCIANMDQGIHCTLAVLVGVAE